MIRITPGMGPPKRKADEMWTRAQVEGMAPDASSLSAGRGLAQLRHWSGLGQSPAALWGLCQGSGKNPYQVQVDLAEPAFRCSCPSRKFPCKHGLGLMLLWVESATDFPQTEPPGWVSDWLVGRQQRSEKKQEKSQRPVDTLAQARRAAQRNEKVDQGVAFLQTWLRDLLRQGLSGLPSWPAKRWEEVAARLIDYQAPGLARQVERLRDLAGGPQWQARLPGPLGRLHLLLEAYTRREQLGPQLQAEIRSRIGWTQSQEEVLQTAPLTDHWLVVGQQAKEEELVSVLRTWLWGRTSGRAALLLEFAAGGRPLTRTLQPGMAFAGELCYFAGAFPLRALVRSRQNLESWEPQGWDDLSHMQTAYAEALAHNPWVEEFPVLLGGLRWTTPPTALVDSQGQALPCRESEFCWRMLGSSGGRPGTLFGEWDGERLRVLSAWYEGERWTS